MTRYAPAATRAAVVVLWRRANNLLPCPLNGYIPGQVVVWRGTLFAEQKSLTPIYLRVGCNIAERCVQSLACCEADRLDLRSFMLLKSVKDCSGNPLKKIETKSLPGGNVIIIA